MAELFERSLSKQLFCARYSVLRLLGSGAYGKVFLARQNALNRPVAIKFFSPRQSAVLDDDAARFLLEMRLLAKLSHPNVLPVYDASLLGKSRFLVAEYLDGGDLAGRLLPDQPLEVAEAIRICAAVAEALCYLQGQGVIHRDLKPENVLLGASDAVKVSDFGLAKTLESDRQLTAPGEALGTPAYMAPEVFAYGETTPACDVYALGILLYCCFDGRFPFCMSKGLPALMEQKLQGDVPRPRACVPSPLVPVIGACLKSKPLERPTAREVCDVLARLAHPSDSGLELPASPPPRPPRGVTQRLAPAEVLRQPAKPPRQCRPTVPMEAPSTLRTAAGWLTAGLAILAAFWLGRFQATRQETRPVQPLAAAATPAEAPAPAKAQVAPSLRLDEVFVTKLCRAVRTKEIDWSIRSGLVDSHYVKRAVEGPELLSLARQLVAAGGELPTAVIPEQKLVTMVMGLQSLRLAAGKYRAFGAELPKEYEAVAAAICPLLKEPPPRARPVLDINHGVPWAAPLDLTCLGSKPEGRPLELPVALLRQWQARGSHRIWWVMRVRGLDLGCVLDLCLQTVYGDVLFPFIASERPLRGLSKPYDGVMSLGFDSRVMHRLSGPLRVSFMSLRWSDAAAPVIERLELWE